MKVLWTNSPGPGLVGFHPAEVFEVDGILYISPGVGHRMRCDEDPQAPAGGTGEVVRRPMIGVFLDHVCAADDIHCDPSASGRAFRWAPYGNGPQRSSP